MTPRPPDHPLRAELHNEAHARPPQALKAPLAITHIVMVCDAAERERSRAHLARLLRERHLPVPDAQATHLRMELDTFWLRWELHTEFVSWTFLRALAPADIAAGGRPPRAADEVPAPWLAELPGRCLDALQLWLLPQDAPLVPLNEDTLVGATLAGGQARVYTDFALHADGCARMVLVDAGLTPRQLGRLAQQLIEIDTYRMMALLGLPAARDAAALLGDAERELTSLADAVRVAARDEEPVLLDRLTRLAGRVESHYATTHARFSASAAYFELIDQRIADIDETQLNGLQTLGEFIFRRLSPARATCAWAVRRQDALSQRVSRLSNLLRTRVEIEQQQSSQALLATMNQRQGLQLRLQATVEGLSVAAITYYIVGLVSYLAKAAKPVGWPFSAESTAACAIPVVALGVWWSLRRLHHQVLAER